MRSYKLQLSSARDNMANVRVDIQVRDGPGECTVLYSTVQYRLQCMVVYRTV